MRVNCLVGFETSSSTHLSELKGLFRKDTFLCPTSLIVCNLKHCLPDWSFHNSRDFAIRRLAKFVKLGNVVRRILKHKNCEKVGRVHFY